MATPRKATSNKPRGFSRRDWLKLGGLTGLGAVGLSLPGCNRRESQATAAAPTTGQPRSTQPGQTRPVKNVVVMVSDGMSTGVPTLAELMSPQLRQRGTAMAEMLLDPQVVRTLIATESADSWVTDSAAAATAMGSGHLGNNGTLNIMPDSGEPMLTLAQRLRAAGKRVGLVTTDRVCGATPAGYAAVQENRNDYDDIAPQLIDRVDVLLGGGRTNFDPLVRSDGQDIMASAKARSHQLLLSRQQLLGAAASDRCLGLFGEGKLPYTIDHRHSAEHRQQVPTLSEMTAHAIACLRERGDGFFLMVEAARVDHAAHVNDAAALLWDQLAFDDAVAVARDFAAQRDDTLFIVTTDHGNANPGLNGKGHRYTGSSDAGKLVGRARASFSQIEQPLMSAARQESSSAVREVIAEGLGVKLHDNELRFVIDSITKADHERHTLDADVYDRHWFSMLAQVMGNHHGVGWTSTAHTHDIVTFLAKGPGAQAFLTARHHVDVNHRLAAALSV